jgi:hypothetical protein
MNLICTNSIQFNTNSHQAVLPSYRVLDLRRRPQTFQVLAQGKDFAVRL